MKRDYYRGSQDSLADRSMSSGMLYKGVLFIFVVPFFFSFMQLVCYNLLVFVISVIIWWFILVRGFSWPLIVEYSETLGGLIN